MSSPLTLIVLGQAYFIGILANAQVTPTDQFTLSDQIHRMSAVSNINNTILISKNQSHPTHEENSAEPCLGTSKKYYYDRRTDSCHEFVFGGCQGNNNDFNDQKSCEQRYRKSTDATPIAAQTTTPVTTIPSKSSTCSLPMDVGPCDDDVTAYYYDANARACQAFIYGGCEGNANRFQTEEQCERLCGSFQGQDVCNIQADPGPCFGAFPEFYYDSTIRGCRRFLYGGCDGNANRFTSEEECASVCIHREEPTVPGNSTEESNLAICQEPVSVGSCSIGSCKRFYYDEERLNCVAFVYTGCGGNRNRFKSYESCIRTCSSQSLNEVDVGPREFDSKDPCFAARAACNTIRCQYGTEDYVDDQNCAHCRCVDTCSTQNCAEGSKCAITLVADGDSFVHQSICRSILKPGNCPKVSNTTTCEEECSSDADCTDDFKCCANGCGSSCLEPAPVEPSVTSAPQFDVTALYPDAQPATIQQPAQPNVTAEEGGYVIMECACTGNPRPSITWRKGATLIDNTVSRHSISVEGSLQIVSLYRTDAGIYTCTADNRIAAPVRIQYILDITEPHVRTSVILGEPNYRVTVPLNSPTVLQCLVTGWPRPSAIWWRGDRIVPLFDGVYERQRDHSLRIHRVSLTTLGIYTCQAYNGIQKPTSWSVILQAPGPVHNLTPKNSKYAQYLVEPLRRPAPSTLSPQYPSTTPTIKAPETQTDTPSHPQGRSYILPVLIPDSSSEIVSLKYTVLVKVNVSAEEGPFPVGSEFSIACNVDGFPIPRVGWLKDDNPIEQNNRIRISDANRLIISDAEKSDGGKYRCQAANEYTSDADTIDIKVAGIFIHPNCQDNSFFTRCDSVVKIKFCDLEYFAQFCCRSCTEAGQLPIHGPHINETSSSEENEASTVITPGEAEVTTISAVEVTTATEIEITTTSEIPVTTVSEVGEECANSEFGCCPDNKTIATGSNFERCGVINIENCTTSYYGCCPDGVAAALEPNNQGCHIDCENTAFGCCDDGSTPAHGPEKEGCCLKTPYGCCPDNIRHAQGPDLHGYGCQYSRYGCCPDNTTTVRGRNNEGCACEHTPHGCCPNRVDDASGPNFEGCACHTYQFGCCPDGVTVAKGSQRQGCGCENTEFKCCSDGITPAKGENYAGCTCGASKYGCCPDGVEEAQGENFEGCLTVPISPGAACALERDRGSCSDFTVKWFFDTEYGGCSRFWYGGCEGNENRFKSQEECKDVCVEPKGRDACFLPKTTGTCEEYHPKWYYDTDRKQCGQFIYKGCLGNANKFKTRDECEELCVTPDDIDACEQPKEVGLCQGNFTKWYFNKESDSCQEFTYGGCKGNKNNFHTQISCQQQCLTPGRSRDSCSLPREEGNCTEIQARWHFHQPENRCVPFYYTGCGGNRNNYETKGACDRDCPPKIEQNICLLPALLGERHNYTQRWYFDSYEKRCRQFYYGGRGGNENNFETEYDCTYRCRLSHTTPAPVAEEFHIEFCFLPEEYGPCNEDSVKWFYDRRDGVCKLLWHGGCAGKAHNFDTAEECETRCGNVQDLCKLPPVVGPCRAASKKYYYDRRTNSCREFVFGGCEGNKNNFNDQKSCERRCKKSTAATTIIIKSVEPITEIQIQVEIKKVIR